MRSVAEAAPGGPGGIFPYQLSCAFPLRFHISYPSPRALLLLEYCLGGLLLKP